ncbi:MAG: hypothetical protein N4A76_10350 [Firmicutes bacterium]|jgi:PKD repeat protein|nr:hypothetical protein [Bacillota bacterium]
MKYTEKFKILENFQKNEHQTVLTGTEMENDSNVVVINIFKKDDYLTEDTVKHFKNDLGNVIHTEENDDEIIVVTKYLEGIPLKKYLQSYDTTEKNRLNFALEYLEEAKKYDNFDNMFKNILINENQIIMKDDKLYFNELMIIKDNDENVGFDRILTRIKDTLNLIISPNNDKIMNPKISDFFTKLSTPGIFNSLSTVYEEFKSIYIYDLYLDSDEEESIDTIITDMEKEQVQSKQKENNQNVIIAGSNPFDDDKTDPPSTDEAEKIKDEELEEMKDLFDHKPEEEKPEKEKNKKLIIFLVALIAIIALIFAFKDSFKAEEPKAPVASFTYEKEEDIYIFTNTSEAYGKDNSVEENSWVVKSGDKILGEYTTVNLKLEFQDESTYDISLTVKDKKGQMSETYTVSIDVSSDSLNPIVDTGDTSERLDNFTLKYGNDGTVQKDETTFRSGTYSLKLDMKKGNGTADISLSDIFMTKNATLSMWIKADTKDRIDIEIVATNSGENKFKKIYSFVPKEVDVWEKVSINMDTSLVDNLKLVFSSEGNFIWVDDIEINSYK